MTRILTWALITILVLGVVATYAYILGHHQGSVLVQAQWDTDKIAYWATHDALLRQFAKQEAAHQEQQKQVADELALARKTHAAALVEQRATYEQRLLQSARRDQAYRKQAETGAAACRDLAGHAARLDRALEEGRGLVQELRGTLGLRDRQLMLLGEQILADRRLMTEVEPK